jgi:hypothetical protein
MAEDRTYSVEEADASLPELREVLERVRSNRQVILRAAERIRGKVAADGGGIEGTDYWEAREALKTDIQSLAQRNVLLRDPETGLIDFPSEREGRRIFLCWRLGEDHVAHWHDLESGFAGRRPL